MVLSFVKDQIGFDDDKKKKKKLFYVTEKIKFVSIFEKDIFYEEDLIHKIISCYITQPKQTTKQQFMISFFISKICMR